MRKVYPRALWRPALNYVSAAWIRAWRSRSGFVATSAASANLLPLDPPVTMQKHERAGMATGRRGDSSAR